MINSQLLDALRYKSEGTDLDFKREQYRFAGGSDAEKSELLKDILAIANAWRDGTGYILLGFRDNRPHMAEVVGISESIDDSRLQQFVNSKVKPKLAFSYEEHLYEGKTVGVISIPKQKRPFFIANPYGKLRSNVAYVRRGSSTEEAEPTEVAAMALADDGRRGQVRLELAVLTPDNNALPTTVERRYFEFQPSIPDFQSPRLSPLSLRDYTLVDNPNFFREMAEYLRAKAAAVEMKFVLTNLSETPLTDAKLEVMVESLDGKLCAMCPGERLAIEPQPQRSKIVTVNDLRQPPTPVPASVVVDDGGPRPICHVRFGSLLPGEEGRSSGTLALIPSGPGQLRLRLRVLAAELSAPHESERTLVMTGQPMRVDSGEMVLRFRYAECAR